MVSGDVHRPKVFLSHSGYDGVVRESIDALASALEREGYETRLDRRELRAGNDFWKWIGDQIQQCDAAVVQISPRALETTWVSNELQRLLQRRHADPKFPCIPWLIDGCTV